jgi:hypothetical protein
MLVAVIRIGFAGLWAVLGLILLLRHTLLAPEMYEQYDPKFLTLGGLLALLLAVFNVLRWLLAVRQARRRTAPRNPLAPRGPRPRDTEYHPEWDFTNGRGGV